MVNQTFIISFAIAEPIIFAPMQRTLVFECSRANFAQNGSWQTAAFRPYILFAIKALPYPTPSIKIPALAFPSAMANAAGYIFNCSRK